MSNPSKNALIAVWPKNPSVTLHLMISGGADSMALLYLVSELSILHPQKIIVHHCNHGLNKNSDKWAEFVSKTVATLSLTIQVHRLELDPYHFNESLAREARYKKIERQIKQGDVVMTAHHQDDQVETLLIRLSQGTGLLGLEGIRKTRSFGLGTLVRPFLNISKVILRENLKVMNKGFVNDPSNLNLKFLRNFIRHIFIPRLRSCNPEINEKILSIMELARVINSHKRKKLGDLVPKKNEKSWPLPKDHSLLCWQIRFWVNSLGIYGPTTKQLEEFSRQVFNSSNDRQPELKFGRDDPIILKSWGKRIWYLNELEKKHLRGRPNRIASVIKLNIQSKTSKSVRIRSGIFYYETFNVPVNLALWFNPPKKSFFVNENKSLSLSDLANSLVIPPWRRVIDPLILLDDVVVGWGDVKVLKSDDNVQFSWMWIDTY